MIHSNNTVTNRVRRVAIIAFLLIGAAFSLRASTASVSASTAATKVKSAHQHLQTQNIEDLQVGDLVLARDEYGTEIGLKPIKEVYRRTSNHLRHLTFEAADGTRQTLSTTDEHPFWSVSAGKFIEAGRLPIGHQVTGPLGFEQRLVQSQREEKPYGVPVFNFQVEGFHTYYVKESNHPNTAILVHNANHAYRVMSPDEITSVNAGGWADHIGSEIPGVKQLWTDEAAARRWQEFLTKQNGRTRNRGRKLG